MHEITPQELEHPIQQLKMHAAIKRLLLHLGGHADMRYTPGRYHVLISTVKRRSELFATLLSDSDAQIQSVWSAILNESAKNIRFMHGLAVVYQEIVQANLAQSGDKLNDSVKISTALWALLLCTPNFWRYFSPARIAAADGEREKLTTHKEYELITTTLDDLFSWHSREGRKALAAGNSKRAHMHLFCLNMCRKGEKNLKYLLDSQSIPYPFAADSQLIRRMTDLAGQHLDAWCDSLLEEAERIATDPKAIKTLPAGVRQNYQGGIAFLKPFIQLNIPMVPVLLASLTYSNAWASDIHHELANTRYQGGIVPFSALRRVLSPLVPEAIPIADQLASLVIRDKGNAFKPEVREIGNHLYYRAILAKDDEQAIKICDEALTWEPGSDWHQRLRSEFFNEIFYKYVEQITAAIRDVREDATLLHNARAFLKRVEGDATLQDQVQAFRPGLNFYHALILARDGQYRSALTQARAAHVLALATNQPELALSIQNVIKDLELSLYRLEGWRYSR